MDKQSSQVPIFANGIRMSAQLLLGQIHMDLLHLLLVIGEAEGEAGRGACAAA